MELKLDTEKFDEIQGVFIKEFIQTIHVKLVEAGLEGATLENTVANLSYSLASILDDTSNIESNGIKANPFLTFRTDDDELIHCGENSYTYEYVTDNMKEMYE
ncbi:MAG: hypothetical protein HQL46_12030 [Gammaproteobacteria bacterium]|nr:hypothetical protein [Gammaproteobacteria bacterium]